MADGASTIGVTAAAYSTVKGVIASYQAYGSNSSSIAESKKKLKWVKSRLGELSPEQRKKIESENTAQGDCSVLKGLELQLDT